VKGEMWCAKRSLASLLLCREGIGEINANLTARNSDQVNFLQAKFWCGSEYCWRARCGEIARRVSGNWCPYRDNNQ